MGWHLDGRARRRRHPHARPDRRSSRPTWGDGYVTDPGMVGPRDPVIGAAIEPTLRPLLDPAPWRAPVPHGPAVFNAPASSTPRGTAVLSTGSIDSIFTDNEEEEK